jgi:predicted RNase H-like HicB family nuclease
MTTHDPTAPVSPEIERQVAEIMARPYRKVITGDAEDGFLATVPDLPDCVTAGETAEEALALLHDAMEGWLISVLERDLPVPEPSRAGQYGGKVMVRMPKSLHRRLMEQAEEEGVSANQLAVAILAEGLAPRANRREIPSADEVRSHSARYRVHGSEGRIVSIEVIGEEREPRDAVDPSATFGDSPN